MGQGNAATMFCFLATDLMASCAACAAQGDPHVWILKYGSGDIEALVTTDFVSVGSYTARMSLGNWNAAILRSTSFIQTSSHYSQRLVSITYSRCHQSLWRWQKTEGFGPVMSYPRSGSVLDIFKLSS
jgi:hypothetical protein